MFRPVSRCVRGSGLGWSVYPLRGYSARTWRALRRHKNGEYAAKPSACPAFQQHETHAEGSDTAPPHRSAKKMQNGSFYHLPQQGSRRNPAKRFRWDEDERQRERERASPAACGGTRNSSSARTTASIAFVWSAAKPLPCQMHRAGKALHPNSGRKPGPTFSYDWRKP